MEKSLIPLSFIAEYAYCPRSCYWLLTKAPRARDENIYIQDGRAGHSIVEKKYVRSRTLKRQESSMRVYSKRLNISGKVDVVEFYKNKDIIPVEFKRGARRKNKMHQMQLALAALCLREMFLDYTIKRGAIFFIGDKRRIETLLIKEILEQAEQLALEVSKNIDNGLRPQDFPALQGRRCKGCCFTP